METLSALLAAIPQPDVAGMARAQQHIDGLLKPPGSLGRLDILAGLGGESALGRAQEIEETALLFIGVGHLAAPTT